MVDPNPTIDHQIRPAQLQTELGIKKDAYYAYLKHLGIKAQKDVEGKSYLEPEQADLIRRLRAHVVSGGRIEEFSFDPSLSVSGPNSLEVSGPMSGEVSGQVSGPVSGADPSSGLDIEALMREAAELAGHRMTLSNQLVLQLASQMTYEDLPEEVRVKVDSVRAAAQPSEVPGKLAAEILCQWRKRRQGSMSATAA